MSKTLLARICKPYRKLDSVSPAKEIWSLNVQVEGYSGPLGELYSTNTTTYLDAYSIPNGKINTSTIVSHSGGEDVLFRTWYGQKGFSNLIQNTTSRMYKIYDEIEGVLLENGESILTSDNSNDLMDGTLPYADSEKIVSGLVYITIQEIGEQDFIIGQTSTNVGIRVTKTASDAIVLATYRTGATSTVTSTGSYGVGDSLLIGFVVDRSNIYLYINGVLDNSSTDDNSDFTAGTSLRIGSTGGGTLINGASIGMVAFWLSNESDNMAEYYEIISTTFGVQGEAAQTFNVASSTYVTGTTGDLSDTVFPGDILGSISIEKELGFFVWGNESNVSVSSLKIANVDGKYDSLLTSSNLRDTVVTLEVVDEDAAYSTATQIGEFIIDDINNKDDDSLSIDLVSKISLLDRNTVHEHFPDDIVFANNQEQPEPIVIGSVYQVAMPLVDDVDNIYEMTADSAVNSIIDVKDRADPLVITTDWSQVAIADTGGRGIDLVNPPDGTITASFIGKNYGTDLTNTFEGFTAKLLLEIAGLETSDVDFTSAAAIDTEFSYKYGCYIPSGTNIKTILDSLVASHCGFYYQNNDGEIAFDYLQDPAGTATEDITYINLASGVKISMDRAPGLSDSAAARKNWHVYSYDEVRDISGLSEEDKQTVSSDFVYYVRSTTTTAGGRIFDGSFAHARNGDYTPTLLVDEDDALSFIGQQEDLYSVARSNYEFDYLSDDILNSLTLELNETIDLTHTRYGLEAGKKLRVTKIKIDDVLKNEMTIRAWG